MNGPYTAIRGLPETAEKSLMRFFFHSTGGAFFRDREGTELASLSEAQREAVILAGAILQRAPDVAKAGQSFSVEVCDEDGRVAYAVTVKAELATG